MPDPFRIKHREQLSLAVQRVIRDGKKSALAIRELDLPAIDKNIFEIMLKGELASINVHNCAIHNVTMKTVKEWVKKGRMA